MFLVPDFEAGRLEIEAVRTKVVRIHLRCINFNFCYKEDLGSEPSRL